MYDPNNRLKQRVCPLRAIATTDLIEIADPENEHDAIRAFSSGQAPAVYRMLDRGRKCGGVQCTRDGIMPECVLKFFSDLTKHFVAQTKGKLKRKCNDCRY
jgi:hypothetical protein